MEPLVPTLVQIEDARRAIRGAAIRTPLVRLGLLEGPAEIYLKLESLQPIGSFKIRGAMNAIAHLSPGELARGVVTASAGNMAQGVAWGARLRQVPCTVLAPETAPEAKVRAVERLGGRVVKVPFDEWWRAFQTRTVPGVEGTFIHAFDDLHVMAGNGTIGLEILEDLPDAAAIVVPWGGGGLASGIAAAIRARGSGARVYAAEAETGAPLAPSLQAGTPQVVDLRRSFVDGIGSRTVFADMLRRAQALLEGSLVATLGEIARAMRLLAERNRVIAEGAGACPVAVALSGRAGTGKVVCVVSGGNIDMDRFCSVLAEAERVEPGTV
jgi:threonine dehydratase